jgi:predicted O-methyltransferase YrrM
MGRASAGLLNLPLRVFGRRRNGSDYRHDDPRIRYEGTWRVVPLTDATTGRLAEAGDRAALTLDFEATGIVVFLWSHPWSGRAFVEVDGVARHVDLYAAGAGFREVNVGGLPPGPHRLTLRGAADADPRSAGRQLIFHRAVCGEVPEKPEPDGPSDYNLATSPGRFGIIYTTPAHMTASERVVLYGLVFGRRPQRCLEIGTYRGGSSLVISAALDDVGSGHLVCVDPAPAIAPEHWAQLEHHATLLKGPSPDLLPDAARAAGGPFDFVLVDGDHGCPGVIRDIEGVLPFLTDDAYLVFHDAHYHGVTAGIGDVLRRYPERLTDCGMISVEKTPEDRIEDGHPVVWGGLRLLRHRR